MRLVDLAKTLGTEIFVPGGRAVPDLEITGVAPLDAASAQELSFLTNPRYAAKLAESKAAAVILATPREDFPRPQLLSKNAYATMAKASSLFYVRSHTFKGHSDLAVVHPTAKVDPTATIYPFAFVDAHAVIGPKAIIYPHTFIGERVEIGAGTVVFASVTVMAECKIGRDCLIHAGSVIGGDGFGFAPTREGIEKIPQIGAVVIGDDCEIGPLNTIDRGAFTDTVIGRGCKFDSQVHVAHGVVMGEYGMIAGGGAIAGSTRIGKRLIMAGHTAVGPSLELGDNITLGPKGGLTRSTDVPGEYMGMPAVPASEWRRQVVALAQLPQLLKKVNALQRQVDALSGAASAPEQAE